MKRMDIFCASQASTSIYLSMDESASSSSSSASAIQLGGRAIDRHNPIIRDAKRFNTNPLPSKQISLGKNGKGSSSSKSRIDHKKTCSSVSAKSNDQKQKSSTKNSSSLKPKTGTEDNDKAKGIDLVTPPGSSRYLLGDSAFLSDYDPVWALVPAEENKIQAITQDHSIISKPYSSSFNGKPPKDKVVVLRVSLHCKGCEGKLRKHLSRMEGVTSFNIDFKAKKVTIVGDVTPSSVLASVSKVKNAQFWTSATATPALASTNFSTKK